MAPSTVTIMDARLFLAFCVAANAFGELPFSHEFDILRVNSYREAQQGGIRQFTGPFPVSATVIFARHSDFEKLRPKVGPH